MSDPRAYTPEEEAVIRATLDQPAHQVAELLGRSVHSVHAKRSNMGLGQPRHRWTRDEDVILLEAPNVIEAQACLQAAGYPRTYAGVKDRRDRLLREAPRRRVERVCSVCGDPSQVSSRVLPYSSVRAWWCRKSWCLEGQPIITGRRGRGRQHASRHQFFRFYRMRAYELAFATLVLAIIGRRLRNHVMPKNDPQTYLIQALAAAPNGRAVADLVEGYPGAPVHLEAATKVLLDEGVLRPDEKDPGRLLYVPAGKRRAPVAAVHARTTAGLRDTLFDVLEGIVAGTVSTAQASQACNVAKQIVAAADLELRWAATKAKLPADQALPGERGLRLGREVSS